MVPKIPINDTKLLVFSYQHDIKYFQLDRVTLFTALYNSQNYNTQIEKFANVAQSNEHPSGLHSEKSFLNLVNPNQIWIVITIFR